MDIRKRIDYEQISKKTFDLKLLARLSKREAKAHIRIEVQGEFLLLHFNRENLVL